MTLSTKKTSWKQHKQSGYFRDGCNPNLWEKLSGMITLILL